MEMKILEVKGPSSFQNDSGETVKFNNLVARIGEREIKCRVKTGLDLTHLDGKDVKAVVKIHPGKGQSPSFEIQEAEEIE